jgi:6-phosphogluconolactonase
MNRHGSFRVVRRDVNAEPLGIGLDFTARLGNAPAQVDNRDSLFFVGTYAGMIGAYRLLRSGVITPAASAASFENPSYLAATGDGRKLIAISERSAGAGAVGVFVLDAVTARLTLLATRATSGRGACHVTVDRAGRRAFVAHYGDGVVDGIELKGDGTVGTLVSHPPGSGAAPPSRAHAVVLSPDERMAIVTDIGRDRLWVHSVEPTAARLSPSDPPFISLAEGDGPRHLVFHPSGAYAYVVNEHGNNIVALSRDGVSGRLTPIQRVSSLPAGFVGASHAADVHVSSDGRFLYASNRGHDSIAVFAIDPGCGCLTPRGHASTGGSWPRSFALAPSGAHIVVANQRDDDVVALPLDEVSRVPGAPCGRARLPKPACIVFARSG